jgi:hypothetical protein
MTEGYAIEGETAGLAKNFTRYLSCDAKTGILLTSRSRRLQAFWSISNRRQLFEAGTEVNGLFLFIFLGIGVIHYAQCNHWELQEGLMGVL